MLDTALCICLQCKGLVFIATRQPAVQVALAHEAPALLLSIVAKILKCEGGS